MYKNIILFVLGLGVLGLGFLVVSENTQLLNLGDEAPVVVTPENPIVEPVNPTDNVDEVLVKFGVDITLQAKSAINFTDGLHVVLKEINDSRCPTGVQCIWAGEISGTFMVSGGKLLGNKEIFLGTERNKNLVLGDYTFTLQNANLNALIISVSYSKTISGGPCYIGGCSSQICSDQKDMMSTCEYSEKYACYKTTKCERQESGQCGWTPTPTLSSCLSKPDNARIY